jgi:hypothetical protein
MQVENGIEAPVRVPKKPRQPRMTAELKLALSEPSRTKSIVVDRSTYGALAVYGRYHGWTLVSQKEGESHRVWRTA